MQRRNRASMHDAGTRHIDAKEQHKNLNLMRKLLIIAIVGAALASCNVTRVVTNESQYVQRGDTSVVIQTKTVETYDASRKLP